MTLAIAWTRKTKNGRELWLMSDSRLSGGKIWDYGPKIFGVGRSDAIMAFAGDTDFAYPLIAQVTSYVESFVNLRDRVEDFIEVQELVLKLLNESLGFISDAAHESLENPKCSFILAGYSARRKEFLISKIYFHSSHRKFELKPARKIGPELFTAIGDAGPVSDISCHISKTEKKFVDTVFQLNMVPSEAFFGLLSSGAYSEIGGAPQVSKIYQRMSQRHFGVYWPPDKPVDQQSIYLRGRRLGKFDVLDHPWVFEPSSGKFYWEDFSPDNFREKRKAESEKA